jgi:hypothetical protein
MKTHPFRLFSTAGLLLPTLLLLTPLDAAVKLLPEASVPGAHLVINNLGPALPEGVQTRFSNKDDYRAVTQSFQWNSPGELLGLGFRLAASQPAFARPQNYLLAIYNAQNWAPRSPVGGPVFAAEIELSGQLVSSKAGGSYLYFDLSGQNVRLAEGGSYVAVLGPDPKQAPIPRQSLFLEASVDSLARGIGNQILAPTLVEVSGNRFNFDLNFFAASSQPASAQPGGPDAATAPARPAPPPASAGSGGVPASAAAADKGAARIVGVTLAPASAAGGPDIVINSDGDPLAEAVPQARWHSPADYRALTQSFQWTSDGELTRAGFRLGRGQEAFRVAQNYIFAIYQASGWEGRSTLGPAVFTGRIEMTPELTGPRAVGNYIQLDLAPFHIKLARGQCYLLLFAPDPDGRPVPGHRLFLDAAKNPYRTGTGGQIPMFPPDAVTGTRFNFDLVFFLAASSQPASAQPAGAAAAAAAPSRPAPPPAAAGAVPASAAAAAGKGAARIAGVTLAPASAADGPDIAINSDGDLITEASPQARWHSPADYRALTQSFQWTSDGELTRAGFRLGREQAAFRVAENYIFAIYQASGWAVGSTLGPAVFTGRIEMTPELIGPRAAGNYIQLDLAPFHIKLARGQCYLLLLAPDPGGRPAPGQRVFLGAAKNPYQPGTGSQITMFPPDKVTGTRFNFDMVFFLASSSGGAVRPKSKLAQAVTNAPAGTFFAYPHHNGFHAGEPVLAKYAGGTQYFILYNPEDGRESVLGSVTGLARFAYYDIAENGLAAVEAGNAIVLVDLSGVAPNRVLYKAPADCRLHMPTIRPDASAVAVTLEKKDGAGEYQLVSIEVESGRAATLMTKPFLLNHAQFSPFAPDWIMVSHEGSASQVKDRIWGWHATLAPGGKNLFAPQTGANGRSLMLGHERPLWHGEGQVFCVYAASSGKPAGLYEVDFSGRARVVSEGDAWHCDISRDGKWAVVDTQGDGAAGDIVAVNCRTGARVTLVEKIAYTRHPWHPHPRISPDGKWVIYNNAAENNAGFIKISQPELAAFAP